MSQNNTVVNFAKKPQGQLTADCFSVAEAPRPSPAEGEVLVKNKWLSIDAANRAWMESATYRSQVMTGQVMDGYALGEVIESNSPDLLVGSWVRGDLGWQQYGVHKASLLTECEPYDPASMLISALGISGLTAWHGLFGVGRPLPGETVLVSAAAGSVGSLVGQMAKIHGCRVVGVAGGAEKCNWVTQELGFDACVDYKSEGALIKKVAAECPNGVDLYFDNVGGQVTEAALFLMNNFGRIVCCGAVSQYDTTSPISPRGIPGLIVVKRLRMEGFVVMDFADRDTEALEQMKGWIDSGQLKVPEHKVHGLQNAPQALLDLLAGKNKGKVMVEVT